MSARPTREEAIVAAHQDYARSWIDEHPPLPPAPDTEEEN